MKALEPDVLQNALEIQDFVLGPTAYFDPRRRSNEIDVDALSDTDLTPDLRDTLHAINGLSNSSWFFHSPLQYWSCSSQKIADDTDIITTVNRGSHQSTSVNVTLRPSVVLGGKRFEDHRLVAADALVITLAHMLDSPVGRQWERKVQEISRRGSDRWRMYPADNQTLASTLHEIRFQPLSIHDNISLGLAYALTTFYFAVSLSQLRALKSKLGLLVAVATQITGSIMSSFTICAIFKIDLSKLPREAYPLVILTIGLENIFRLVNAVITTPSESSAAARMAEGLGLTGHIALFGLAQNLFVLWVLSRIVSPGVASFCIFAMIALTFDFFYLLTFFGSVLSIDLRRTELSDALSRASLRHQRYAFPDIRKRSNWTKALVRGYAPVSTRIAGTIIMICFIIAAQWHFSESSFYQTTLRFVRHLKPGQLLSRPSSPTFLSGGVNQAETLPQWLQMQDHETAHEIISLIKPNSHSYIARVYDPLVFVLSGSDRTPTKFGVRPFLPAAYDFARHQSAQFIITVVLIIAAVALLMNYLLWDEMPGGEANDRPEDKPLLSVKTLSHGHALDVVLLTASNEGVVVSVGLDRRIRVWNVRSGKSYVIQDPESDFDPFPVLAMAIDNDSNWLALLSSRDLVALWNIPERRWGPKMQVEVKGRTPAAFIFGSSRSELIDPVILVRHNGLMSELHIESNRQTTLQICKTPLVCVRIHAEKAPSHNAPRPPLRVITSSRRGCVHVAYKADPNWISEEVPCSNDAAPSDEISSILPLPALSCFLAVRTHMVELIDITSLRVICTFATKSMKQDTLRCFHSMRQRPRCGSLDLDYLAFAYTTTEEGDCVLQSYLPKREGDVIHFPDPRTIGSKTSLQTQMVKESVHVIEQPGTWDVLPVGYVVGVRKVDCNPSNKEINTRRPATWGLRRRGAFARRHTQGLKTGEEKDDLWEVWSLSLRGDNCAIRLSRDTETSSELLVSSLGPMEKFGQRSLAVGLGNVVKIVTVGTERYDNDNIGDQSTACGRMTGGRKKRSGVGRKKSC
jgi:hypothetical protein